MKRIRAGGFTLIELLVVIAIVALLIAILLPSMSRARQRARTTLCLSNVRQISHAFYFYTNEYDGFANPRAIAGGSSTVSGPPGYWLRSDGTTPGAFWSDQILLGQYAGSTNGNNMNPQFVEGAVSRHSPFMCPSDQSHPFFDTNAGTVSYGMPPNFTSIAAPFGYSRMWKVSNAVAPMTEMMLVDSLSPRTSPGGWSDPYVFYGNYEPLVNGNWNDSDPNSYYNWARRHNGGANVLFLDGHAETLLDLKAAYDRHELTVHRVE